MFFKQRIHRVITIFILGLLSWPAFSQTTVWEPWNEKWPVDVKIVPDNAVVLYLRSNFGKVGEIAADKLQNLLNDPASQAKLSVSAINYLKALYNDANTNQDEKAKQFIAAIEADIAGYVSAPGGSFGITAGFSGSYSVTRLSWTRQTQRLMCQRERCTCNDGTQVSSSLHWCYGMVYVGGGQYEYRSYLPTCSYTTDTVDVEPEYKIYRNGKHVATFGEVRNVTAGQSLGGGFSFGFVNLKLNAVLPPGPLDSSGKAGPFYDYDPYNLVLGTPLGYRITASSSGCGPSYMNQYVGQLYAESSITVDSNGDARPDFYPADVLQQKRTQGPFAGTKVNEHTDASGKVSVAVFERVAPTSQQHFKDFMVTVPTDYVVIGGGVEGAEAPQGHLVTASYPSGDLSSWIVSTKDHQVSSPAQIKAWAIGLKVSGLSVQQLREQVTVRTATSPSAQHTDVAVALPADYAPLGGGFRVNWTGAGNLGTASYPDGAQSWRAKSKDHGVASPASTQVFSIGIKRSIAGVGNVLTTVSSVDSAYAAHPFTTAWLPGGYALAGCGVLVNWSGQGNLLWKIKPLNPASQHGCEVASKDHVYGSPATIRGFAIGLAVN